MARPDRTVTGERNQLPDGQAGVGGPGDRPRLVRGRVRPDPAEARVVRKVDRHEIALPDAACDQPAGGRVRAGIPLVEGQRLARADVAIGDLATVAPRHEAQLVDEQLPPVGHRSPSPTGRAHIENAMLGMALPPSAGAKSSALWAMRSSTVQGLPPSASSLASDHPRIRDTRSPHMTKTWPLTSAAASLARKPISGAMLSGSQAPDSPSFAAMGWPPPATGPVRPARALGAIPFTVSPNFWRSRASTLAFDQIPP